MREPSIHITEKKLAEILSELFSELPVEDNAWDNFAKEISKRAKNHSLGKRSVSISNAKMERDIKTLLKSSESDAALLSNLIFHIRRRRTKLYTNKKIEKGTKEYTQLKELTRVCVDFCNTFGFNKKQGFTKYLELAIPKISSSLNYVLKLVNMAETINLLQEAQCMIDNDENSEETKQIHDYYADLISTKTGIKNDYNKDPTTYNKFVEVREITDKLDVPFEIYIDAQFHELTWTNSYPSPLQLVGDKAIERLNKYMFEKKITVKSEEKEPTNILLKLKAKYDNNRSNE